MDVMEKEKLRVLVVEDEEQEARFLMRELGKAGVDAEWERVDNAEKMRSALTNATWDIVLADFTVPGFGATDALALVSELAPDVPSIVVSGTIGEERAASLMRAGARDLILKGRFERLIPAIERELAESRMRKEKANLEEKNRKSEAMLQLIAESLPILISYIDKDLRYRFNNRTYDDWYGVAPEQMYGCRVEDIIGENYAIFESRLKTALAGEAQDFEATVPFKGHGSRHIHATYVPDIRRGGEVVGLFAVNSDISALKKAEEGLRASEQRLKSIMESVGEGIVVIDESGKIESVNPAVLEIFGYRSEELLGQDIGVLMPEPHRGAHGRYIRRYLATGDPLLIGKGARELIAQRKDGDSFPAEISISEMVIGGKRSFIGTIRDITERKLTEEKLRQSQKMEAVGQLTGGVAHDFNNLLAAILGHAELLEADLGNGSASLQVIKRATNRGVELTHRLLAFSRTQTLQPKVLDLNQLINDVVELLHRTLPETIDIDVGKSGGLWLCRVDPGELENALLNLAVNARDAMPQGGRLLIETENVAVGPEHVIEAAEILPGEYVRISVRDNGAGIPPESLKRVFDPFFTTKDVGEGTGLGLSMVYGFVKQSEGHISIDSNLGEGTSISLFLPRSVETEEAEPYRETREVPRGNGEKVLIIEDDRDVRDLVYRILERLGYAVVGAPNGREALALLAESGPFDLILTDIVLPGGKSGPDIVNAAQSSQPETKYLFMSGYSARLAPGQSAMPEGSDLLNKPFSQQELAQRVRAALDA